MYGKGVDRGVCMNQGKYVDIITKYITDPRYRQALLIDGEWGSGKSYFVDHELKPAIESIVVPQKTSAESPEKDKNNKTKNKGISITPNEKEKYYKAVMVSLYGLTSIDDVQNQIFLNFIADSDKKAENIMLVGNALSVGTDFIGVTGGLSKFIKSASAKWLGYGKDGIILIFDDMERCQVDIVTLMGFLNNLCENAGYKVIIIANEKEISKNYTEEEKENDKDYQLYKRTKEKLIGRTVSYEADIEGKYELVLKDNIKKTSEKDEDNPKIAVFIENKETVIQEFKKLKHDNLRTLKSVFIAGDYLLDGILSTDLSKAQDYNEYENQARKAFELAKTDVLKYLSRVSIERVKGAKPRRWPGESRYVFDGSSTDDVSVAYEFVDEYLNDLTADENIIHADILAFINGQIEIEKDIRMEENYNNLSFFKLQNWTHMEDDEVKNNLNRLEEELKEKKYLQSDFGKIVRTLMHINTPSSGMFNAYEFLEVHDVEQTTFDYLDDSYESLANLNVEDNNVPGKDHTPNYSKWDDIDIEKYVNLMCKYFDDPDFKMSKEALRFSSDDQFCELTYRKYINPILECIKANEIKKIQKQMEDIDTFYSWDDDFEKYLDKMKNNYVNGKRFLSLYDSKKILNCLKAATTQEIRTFRQGIMHIYSGKDNLSELLENDAKMIHGIHSALSKDEDKERKHFNPKRSRTKEIALVELQNDLEHFLNFLNSYLTF